MSAGNTGEPKHREKARCPLCRKVMEGVPKQSLVDSELRISSDNKVVTLTFDKKECALVFERLRRFYGDEFFDGLAHL